MPFVVLGLAAVCALVWLVLSRANETFCLSVRDGQCIVVRGHCPPSRLSDIRDVVERRQVERASIRAVRRGGQPALLVSGADEFTAQRLRNTFGTSRWGKTNHQMSDAPRERESRNLGQLLGIAWLAWLFTRR